MFKVEGFNPNLDVASLKCSNSYSNDLRFCSLKSFRMAEVKMDNALRKDHFVPTSHLDTISHLVGSLHVEAKNEKSSF